jgi:hypothetical protein
VPGDHPHEIILNYIEKEGITLEQFKEIEGGKTILKRVG